MNQFKIEDISRKTLFNTQYDLGLFVCGYEPRCTFLSELLGSKNFGKAIVFSYSDNEKTNVLDGIRNHFFQSWKKNGDIIDVLSYDQKSVFLALLNWWNNLVDKSKIKILVDYSSFTKVSLSTIIFFFFRHIQQSTNVELEIDFSYSVGEYPDFKENKLFSYPKVLPGCEGTPLTHNKKSAIYLLGFDSIGPKVVANILNPSKSYGVYAKPSSKDEYIDTVLTNNKEFIQSTLTQSHLLPLPLSSVHTAFDYLAQIAIPLQDTSNVSIVQFGPKPHVLASILLASQFPNVTCIYSKTKDSDKKMVQCVGELVLTRVSFSIER
jgi:hypothetical protein